VIAAVPLVEAWISASRGLKGKTLTVSWTSRYANSCKVTRDGYVISTDLNGTRSFEVGESWDEYLPVMTYKVEATGNGVAARQSTA
jgi:hypothetical protein